jgi:hypothetical protein
VPPNGAEICVRQLARQHCGLAGNWLTSWRFAVWKSL